MARARKFMKGTAGTTGVPASHEGRLVSVLILVPASSVLLSWVSLWNGAPLVFADSVTYASTAWGWGIPEYFSVFYGGFIALLHQAVTLWPVPFIQSGILAHLIYLTARSVSGGKLGAWESLAIVGALSFASALPWVSGQILPDAFTGVVILGIFLLAFCKHALRPTEFWYVFVLTAASISFHLSHVPLAIGLVVTCAIIKLTVRGNPSPQREWLPVALGPLLVATCALMSVNWISTRQVGLARGGDVFLLARLIDRGPALRYLQEACPGAAHRLCSHVDELKGISHDELKWSGHSPFKKIGGPDELQPEARRILQATLISRPWEVVAVALHDSARQIITFQTGDGLSPDYAVMFARQIEPLFGAGVAHGFVGSGQAQGTLPISALRPLHTVAIVAGVILCSWFAAKGVRGVQRPDTLFQAFVLSSIVVSAITTGALAGPYDRYLARVAWLLPLAAMTGLLITLRQRGRELAECSCGATA